MRTRTLLKRGVRESRGVRDARGLRATRSLRDSGGLSDSRGLRESSGLRDIRSLRDDRGVSILEFAGFLPILLVIGMAAIQLGLIGYGINQAGTGARAAARVASQGGDGAAAGQAAVSGWLSPDVSAPEGPDVTTATVTVTVPNVIPLFADVTVVRHATMPTDD
ncbi:TadE/TadG family type IV pilus assembly protein [Streptomyces sp. NPDC058466]|uniref:TadE/TadG family type IV pilus assembly protein n=1 Tax=Streptomyces sp. NPDC058466 TaxID=3346512 RepID=UPI003662DBFC